MGFRFSRRVSLIPGLRVNIPGLRVNLSKRGGGAVNPAIAQRWVCSWTLEDVEEYLNRPDEPPSNRPAS
jgi:hypothetical protein